MQILAYRALVRPVALRACPNPSGPRHKVANLAVASCTIRVGLHHRSPVGQWHPGPHGCWAAVTCRDTSDSLSSPKKAVACRVWLGDVLAPRAVCSSQSPPAALRAEKVLEHRALWRSLFCLQGCRGGFESHQTPAANLAFRRGSEEELR